MEAAVSPICSLCHTQTETSNHLLLNVPTILHIWDLFLRSIYKPTLVGNISSWFWSQRSQSQRQLGIFVSWYTWKMWNDHIFNHAAILPSSVKKKPCMPNMKVTYQIFYLHQGFLLMLPPVPWLPSRDLYAKLNFDGSYIPLIEKDELEASSTIHPDSYWPHSRFKPRCIRSKSNSKHSLQVFNFVSTLANDCLSWKVTVLFWRSRTYTTARILPWGFMDKWKTLLELRIELLTDYLNWLPYCCRFSRRSTSINPRTVREELQHALTYPLSLSLSSQCFRSFTGAAAGMTSTSTLPPKSPFLVVWIGTQLVVSSFVLAHCSSAILIVCVIVLVCLRFVSRTVISIALCNLGLFCCSVVSLMNPKRG